MNGIKRGKLEDENPKAYATMMSDQIQCHDVARRGAVM